MSSQTAYPPERIERAARIYHSTGDAAAALGIAPSSFRPTVPALRDRHPRTAAQSGSSRG